jgi:acetyl/propionyl-CoA carboxylase alpha subunit
MYFQAESDKKKYEITVHENKNGWKVSLKPEGEDWVHYEFSKNDYQYMDDTISFLFKDSSYLLDTTSHGVDYTVYTRGAFQTVKIYNEEKILHESLKRVGPMGSSDSLVCQMPGKIVKVFVKPGDKVKEGDPLLVMEAMKMENEMRAGAEVKIKAVHVKTGDTVETNTELISFEKAD